MTAAIKLLVFNVYYSHTHLVSHLQFATNCSATSHNVLSKFNFWYYLTGITFYHFKSKFPFVAESSEITWAVLKTMGILWKNKKNTRGFVECRQRYFCAFVFPSAVDVFSRLRSGGALLFRHTVGTVVLNTWKHKSMLDRTLKSNGKNIYASFNAPHLPLKINKYTKK